MPDYVLSNFHCVETVNKQGLLGHTKSTSPDRAVNAARWITGQSRVDPGLCVPSNMQTWLGPTQLPAQLLPQSLSLGKKEAGA